MTMGMVMIHAERVGTIPLQQDVRCCNHIAGLSCVDSAMTIYLLTPYFNSDYSENSASLARLKSFYPMNDARKPN